MGVPRATHASRGCPGLASPVVVGVGAVVTHGPLHRSGREALSHPAPALGDDGEAREGAWMTDACGWQPLIHVLLHALPRQTVSLAAAWTSRCGLRLAWPQTNAGSPGSRAKRFRTCSGSLTARGPVASRAHDASGVAFRSVPQRRHPGIAVALATVRCFRGSIPGLHIPLSTLRPRPRGRRRMTRGRCGSLALHRMTLSFTTPCRF